MTLVFQTKQEKYLQKNNTGPDTFKNSHYLIPIYFGYFKLNITFIAFILFMSTLPPLPGAYWSSFNRVI